MLIKRSARPHLWRTWRFERGCSTVADMALVKDVRNDEMPGIDGPSNEEATCATGACHGEGERTKTPCHNDGFRAVRFATALLVCFSEAVPARPKYIFAVIVDDLGNEPQPSRPETR